MDILLLNKQGENVYWKQPAHSHQLLFPSLVISLNSSHRISLKCCLLSLGYTILAHAYSFLELWLNFTLKLTDYILKINSWKTYYFALELKKNYINFTLCFKFFHTFVHVQLTTKTISCSLRVGHVSPRVVHIIN